MNNNINIITPINKEENKIIPLVKNNEINNNVNNNSFIASLPEWDLLPQYTVVRRVVRK